MLITGYACFRSSGFLCAAGFKYDAMELSGHNLYMLERYLETSGCTVDVIVINNNHYEKLPLFLLHL